MADVGIFIGSDGSVSPLDAPILRDGDLYTLTGNVTVNATSPGLYIEGIDIMKDNITLEGDGFTIQGHGFGFGVYMPDRNNVTVRNLNVKGFDCGLYLSSSSNCTLSGNNATMNNLGFSLESSFNNTLSGNDVAGNEGGIRLDASFNNHLLQNSIENNSYNLGVMGGYNLSSYSNSIDTSNLVDGKTVYYLANKENLVINPATYPNVGYLGLVDCSNVTVENLTVTRNYQGILFANTTNSVITQNILAENYLGIDLMSSSNNTLSDDAATENYLAGLVLDSSSNNTISGNNFTANSNAGIWLEYSSNNTVYHNNFIDNTIQAPTSNSGSNIWDDGYPSGGNYWSDYNGIDILSGTYQNVSGSDGIGDETYSISAENVTDRYPLMGPFSDFNATQEYHVQTISNSTISDFQFNGTAISFNASGENGTTGFCRICIPTALINGTFTVFINGTEVPYTLLPESNSTHSYLYFTYHHSTQEVIITPEFPSFLILPLFSITTLVAVIVYKKHAH